MPAMQSSQKWLPVAITQNQTQAGQAAQKAFAQGLRQTEKRTTPTISASAACRLGIAAYGLAARLTRPSRCSSTKPSPSSRGGAVGMKM